MVSYKLVPEHNGVELYFDQKPSDAVCAELKAAGWRWHAVKRCWFAKNSDSSLALAKKLATCIEEQKPVQRSVVANQLTAEVRFDQGNGTTYVSTATITKTQRGYHISSTNNQIICCDCRRFFSVHAVACPFCGCPMSYIAENYLKIFDSKALAEQRKQLELAAQRKREEETKQKETLIQELRNNCAYFHSAVFDLRKLDIESLAKAVERALYVEKVLGKASFIVYEQWYRMILSSDEIFQKCLDRATKINKHKHELPFAFTSHNNWERIISLSDTAFEALIREEIDNYWVAEKQKIHDTCRWRGISPEKEALLIEKGISDHELSSRLSYIDYLSHEYRHLNFNLKEYVHLSQPELQKLVSSWLK